jgi:hypothetical protein
MAVNDDDDGQDDDVVVGAGIDDADLNDVVPVAFATPRRPKPERRLTDFSFQKLLGRRVVLRVNGFDVAGVFRGADEDDVYVRGELRWFVYPMASVTGLTVIDDDGDNDDDDDDEQQLQTKRPSDAEIAAGKRDGEAAFGDHDGPRGGLPGDPHGDLEEP